jgi:hypothetical protein
MNRLLLAILAVLTGLGVQVAPGHARACEASAVGAGLFAGEVSEARERPGRVDLPPSARQIGQAALPNPFSPAFTMAPVPPVLAGIDRARE